MRLYWSGKENSLPVKNLLKLICLLSTVVSAVVCLYLYQNKNEDHQIINTIMTFIGIFSIGLCHLIVLIGLSGRFRSSPKIRKLLRYLITYLAAPIAYFLLWPIFAPYSLPGWASYDLHMVITFICSGFVVNTMFLISFDFMILQHAKSTAELEFSMLKATHAEAANLLLKQQIHPHFLFNALNTLKSLYRKDANAGESYIVHLANFLRASIEDHENKLSRLDKELALLNDYLAMQKIRLGNSLCCTINIAEELTTNKYLPSFSLQPLLENAIKHNELTASAPLNVQIYCKDDHIIVCNNLKKKKIHLPSTHYGLANLAQRYKLCSGDEVIIKEDKESFSVSIKLLNHEYSDHRR